jgi:hypothetical protein
VDVPDRSRARDPRVLSIGAVQAPAPEAGILERLKERKVVQWLLAYLAMTWAILQANDALADVWGVPLMVQRAGSLALALGILPVLVVAWYHGEKGRQRVCCVEAGLIGLTLAVTFGTVWRVCFA